MSWPVIVAIAAVLPVAGLVFWLVLRPTTSREIQVPKAAVLEEPSDILAEVEYQEIENSVAAAKQRADLRSATPAASETLDEIEWADDGVPFRPPITQSIALIHTLGLKQNIQFEKRKHIVCITAEAFSSAQQHLGSNIDVELGGLLAGRPYYLTDLDAYLVLINSAIQAPHGKETPVSFEYTSETWSELTPLLQQLPEDQVIVGSYHSHPDLGVFLSTTDVATQREVFPHEWQVAMVIDPVRNETGIFISANGDPVEYAIVD